MIETYSFEEAIDYLKEIAQRMESRRDSIDLQILAAVFKTFHYGDNKGETVH